MTINLTFFQIFILRQEFFKNSSKNDWKIYEKVDINEENVNESD
jgi:hypothetical protein